MDKEVIKHFLTCVIRECIQKVACGYCGTCVNHHEEYCDIGGASDHVFRQDHIEERQQYASETRRDTFGK